MSCRFSMIVKEFICSSYFHRISSFLVRKRKRNRRSERYGEMTMRERRMRRGLWCLSLHPIDPTRKKKEKSTEFVHLVISNPPFDRFFLLLFGQRTRRGRCPIGQRGEFSVRPSERTSERTSVRMSLEGPAPPGPQPLGPLQAPAPHALRDPPQAPAPLFQASSHPPFPLGPVSP